jgi:hypothetical protein
VVADGARRAAAHPTMPHDAEGSGIDGPALWRAKRFGPEALPHLWVASGKMRLVVLEWFTGRPRPIQAGLHVGMVANVALTALLREDFATT